MEKTIIEVNGREFTKEQFVNILKSRQLIDAPGKYRVKARQNTLYEPTEGTPRYIVNLQAATPYHVEMAKKLTAEGDYQKALNQNITVSIFINDDGSMSTYLPANGETVFVEVDWHINKAGEKMLVVNSVSEVPVSEAKSLSNAFEDLFSGEGEKELENIRKEAEKEA